MRFDSRYLKASLTTASAGQSGNSEYLCLAASRRISMLKGVGGLPISCLSCAPTAGIVGPSTASTSNWQIAGRKEDRFKSATESKGRQNAANHLCFGC